MSWYPSIHLCHLCRAQSKFCLNEAHIWGQRRCWSTKWLFIWIWVMWNFSLSFVWILRWYGKLCMLLLLHTALCCYSTKIDVSNREKDETRCVHRLPIYIYCALYICRIIYSAQASGKECNVQKHRKTKTETSSNRMNSMEKQMLDHNR